MHPRDVAGPVIGPVAIVGVGLMGGSLGLALAERAGVGEIRGADPDAGALALARDRGAITEIASSAEEAADGASMVFLAAPVPQLAELARSVLRASGPSCVVSDLGSVKSAVLRSLDARERERFIGGHPVAGGERAGVVFARADLFDGATWFLTPGVEARPELFERLHAIVGAIGARPVAIDPEVHDRLMALVSHLPHVLAGALVNQAGSASPGGREALRSAGPSFADLTRVAGANPPLWTDILLANRDALLDAIEGYLHEVDEFTAALREGDAGRLAEAMERAARGRERLIEEDAAAAEPWRVVVGVPNRPGVISEIATALGHAHINLEDLRVRPGAAEERGELDLVVDGEDAAREAASLVERRGYPASTAPAD